MKNNYSDPALLAAQARALVWETLLGIRSSERFKSTTLADLYRSTTRTAACALGLTEDELIHLLKTHNAH